MSQESLKRADLLLAILFDTLTSVDMMNEHCPYLLDDVTRCHEDGISSCPAAYATCMGSEFNTESATIALANCSASLNRYFRTEVVTFVSVCNIDLHNRTALPFIRKALERYPATIHVVIYPEATNSQTPYYIPGIVRNRSCRVDSYENHCRSFQIPVSFVHKTPMHENIFNFYNAPRVTCLQILGN